MNNISDSRKLVTYRIDDDEHVVEAIVDAFGSTDVEPYDRETVLEDWVNCETLGEMRWESNERLRVSTEIWGHPTTITADTVTIYSVEPDG